MGRGWGVVGMERVEGWRVDIDYSWDPSTTSKALSPDDVITCPCTCNMQVTTTTAITSFLLPTEEEQRRREEKVGTWCGLSAGGGGGWGGGDPGKQADGGLNVFICRSASASDEFEALNSRNGDRTRS